MEQDVVTPQRKPSRACSDDQMIRLIGEVYPRLNKKWKVTLVSRKSARIEISDFSSGGVLVVKGLATQQALLYKLHLEFSLPVAIGEILNPKHGTYRS